MEDGLKHRRDDIQELIETKTLQVQKLKVQLADFECDLGSLLKERSLVHQFCDFLDGKALDDKSSEVSLLLNLLELNLLEHTVDASKDQSTQCVGSSKNCASQTDSGGEHTHGTNRTPEQNSIVFFWFCVSYSICCLRESC